MYYSGMYVHLLEMSVPNISNKSFETRYGKQVPLNFVETLKVSATPAILHLMKIIIKNGITPKYFITLKTPTEYGIVK